MKNTFAVLMLCLCLAGGIVASSGCTTTNGNGVKPLEQMTELEYSKWKLYIQLGVKIGANRLLEEGVVNHEQLEIAAAAIDGIKGEPVAGGAKSLIVPALRKAGFSNDEVEFVLLVAEQELLARGALEWLNPQTNVFELSPRTQEILTIIAASLRTAGTVTPEEKTQASGMKADFCRSSQ
jgi:hypothetical protein